VRPYFSPDDVAKGARWSAEIAKELEASRVGLLVVTPENQEAPWLLFEAGALAKSVERSKVCPLLFGGLEPTDVKGPLVQFQAAQFSEDEMKRVVKMMNAELGEASLPGDVLDNVFQMWWPKLDEEISKELEKGTEDDGEARRPERDLLEEVLALTRRLTSDRSRRMEFDHPAWDELFVGIIELARAACRTRDDETLGVLRRLARPLEYIFHREIRGPGRLRHHRHVLMELEDIIQSTKPPAAEENSEESES
jgi:hypothetical protein